ncbi:hypothetical protein K431DRAFT_246701 [Polychaeton citri CBS 116435]|uniref:NUC153 domain-containing protein n=1 Tax=Polychaeton citri CBS 116435 TaxID=1314669 RepID=A0A9P4UQH8_9PEZI|nr:hypothetical protein K431DRAFT_246701 [Polychaeton citri CBS 116435]
MSDPRFARFRSDPRYGLSSGKRNRDPIDSRFQRSFNEDDNKASVTKYGKPIKHISTKQKAKPQTEADSDGEDASESEVDRAAVRDVLREGFSGSSSEEESESESESESETELELAEGTAGQEQSESIPMGDVSRRIAAVNMDWDHIRASDIMAVAQSFVLSGGSLESVHIYPSEFGKERLQREELEGPPKEIFANHPKSKSKSEDEESSDEGEEEDEEEEEERIKRQLMQGQEDDGAEFDTAKLRQYQLERLRYHYAILTCSSPATAKSIYDNLDSREYLTTANFFDLRFVPDETDFSSDQPREVCIKLAQSYKPNDFRTEALTHSKVRLTWDDDDTTRKEVQKRAFSRSEIDENDLKAYIGSDSSDAESVSSHVSTSTPSEHKVRKEEKKRRSLRERLGLPVESAASSKKDDGPVGEMQITFGSGLGDKKKGKNVFENEPQDEASTLERYIQQTREHKQRRKEKAKTARKADGATDLVASTLKGGENANAEQDLGFEDPFFTNPEAAAVAERSAKKEARSRKREEKAVAEAEATARRAELELLMADDRDDQTKHFDMRDVEKAEKAAKRRGKKGKKRNQAEDTQPDKFEVDASDPRFKGLFDSHEYAIDPTNPKFKGTQGMRTLLEEGRKRKTVPVEDDEPAQVYKREKRTKKQHQNRGTEHAKDLELDGLVSRLKRSNESR